MITLNGTIEIGKEICIRGFTFEYPENHNVFPLILCGAKEAIDYAEKRIKQARKELKIK